MRDRTITINGLSKTYSVTGWRVGWAIAPPEASTPDSQGARFSDRRRRRAAAAGGRARAGICPTLLREPRAQYLAKRDRMLGILTDAGFRCFKPAGRVLHHDGHFGFDFPDDMSFARYLVENIGVAVVPGSSFYDDPADGRAPGALHILQTRHYARRRRRAPRPPARLTRGVC